MKPTIILATAADQPDITASDKLYAEALQRRGINVAGAPWDGPRAAFAAATAVVIRSTWGYYRTAEAFRDWTEAMAAATLLFNPIALVRWNLRKDYIGKLAAAGVRVPQSHFVAAQADAIGKGVQTNRLGARRREAGDGRERLLGRACGARRGRGLGRPASR
jgi:hypothetical protein